MSVLSKRFFFRLLVYFRRGYGLYGVFLSAFNTANILLLVATQLFHVTLKDSILYTIAFIAVVVTVMAAIGWWDFRQGQREQEVVVHVKTDPVAMATITLSFESTTISARSMRLMAEYTGDSRFAELADELERAVEERRKRLREIGVPV